MRRLDLVLRDEQEVAVLVGRGACRALSSLEGYDAALLVYDPAVPGRIIDCVAGSLKQAVNRVEMVGVPGGEAAKTVDTLLALWKRMAELGLTRSSIVAAVGGGTVLDVVGFAAATYMRGVDWAAVPTTSLAMFDAAVGGKTGVNLGAKNVVGAFHHPRYVVADVDALASLPKSVYSEGFAELVKHAVLEGYGFLSWLESVSASLASGSPEALEEAVYRSLAYKVRVVAADYRERRGLRYILNLGHTVGHAVEAATGYRVSHGRAVALGLLVELEASVIALGAPEQLVERVRRLLEALGLAIEAPGLGFGELARFVALDKKRVGGRIRLPLVRDAGTPVVVEMGFDEALGLLEQAWRRVTA